MQDELTWNSCPSRLRQYLDSPRQHGHSAVQTALTYLELVPDPSGSLAAVP